jgi:hypothetical protein
MFSGGAGMDGGAEVGAEVDGVEDDIDVGCKGWSWCCYWSEGWNLCW